MTPTVTIASTTKATIAPQKLADELSEPEV